MKHTLSVLKMLVPVVVMSLIMLAPAAAPIITPRATCARSSLARVKRRRRSW